MNEFKGYRNGVDLGGWLSQCGYELIADINRSGVTVVMVTHDVSAALKYAGHILCMRQGLTRESWFFGTPEEFLTSSASDFLKGGAVNG